MLGHDNVPVPVAFVLSSFDPGGTERQMIELIRRLDRKRWQVHLVCFRASGAWYERAAEAAESVATFPIASFLGPEIGVQLRRFARWCRDQRIAVVHTGQLHSNIFGLPGAALARVPVRVANRRMLKANKPGLQLAVQRVAYAFAHKVVANSLAAAARLKAEGVPARKIAVITNGVDCDRFTRVPSRWSARRVVMVANLRPEKGHDVLIAAAVSVLRRFPDATFDIIGDGPEMESLKMMARDRAVDHAVTFYGHREDVPELLAEGGMLVLPSRSEALPNAVLEAMAARLPVVASDVGGVGELIVNGRTGWLVPAGDAAALAERICGLMADPGLAGAFGVAGRAAIDARYTFERMVGAFDRLYETELRRRCPVFRWHAAAA
ncbi:MAG: hypothetical protein AUI11_13175 [Acidobacteria bacterium 13_2_20CM_2_66_4]|nr:MAG: hypothetical protein AUI11_13175 [Acidobacteria bacterium 13_2_20CM_2_66_4]